MKTFTLKLPEMLEIRLNTVAREQGMSRSEVVRQALAEYLSRVNEVHTGTLQELVQDLAGSIEGPPDLSTNKSYLDDYGQ